MMSKQRRQVFKIMHVHMHNLCSNRVSGKREGESCHSVCGEVNTQTRELWRGLMSEWLTHCV